jgi:hypothetical protein
MHDRERRSFPDALVAQARFGRPHAAPVGVGFDAAPFDRHQLTPFQGREVDAPAYVTLGE